MIEVALLKEFDQLLLDIDLKKKKRIKRIFDPEHFYEGRLKCIEGIEIRSEEKELTFDEKLDPTFIEMLFKIIDERNLKDSDVYNKVGIDRKLFSKIRNGQQITKNNAINLCIALELNIHDTEDLLMKAGFALSKSVKRDAIIRKCIEHEIYDVNTIDEYLVYFKLKTIIKYPE